MFEPAKLKFYVRNRTKIGILFNFARFLPILIPAVLLFNSIAYLFLFLPIVTLAYFLLPQRYRWCLLLGASYFFYMYWKWQYGLLMLLTTFITYTTGLLINRAATERQRTGWFVLGLGVDIAILFFFKYFNFVGESLNIVFNALRVGAPIPTLDLILPVGISFYTFQSLSYTIDVYRRKHLPEKHFGLYALYVAFFPQLVAGPIERSQDLLPQFRETHTFSVERLIAGARLILWGLFKKVVIADSLGLYVNRVYADLPAHQGIALLLAMLFFVYQIYCDFSGYSDIAHGSARILGYRLTVNFNFPFRARSYSDLWARWHITLTNWFREYLYIPLGGNRVKPLLQYRNTLFIFALIGLWHGAAWNFVLFGILQALVIIAALATKKQRQAINSAWGIDRYGVVDAAIDRIMVVGIYAIFAGGIFRAKSVADYVYMLTHCWSFGLKKSALPEIIFLCLLIFCFELIQYPMKERQTDPFLSLKRYRYRLLLYLFLIFAILLAGNSQADPFLYFQF